MKTPRGATWRSLVMAVIAVMISASGVLADTRELDLGFDGRGQDRLEGSRAGTLSGSVTVRGSATVGTSTAPPAPAAKPLVADAGDSSFVAAGASAWLLGTGFGGIEPYTFAWSAAAGTDRRRHLPDRFVRHDRAGRRDLRRQPQGDRRDGRQRHRHGQDRRLQRERHGHLRRVEERREPGRPVDGHRRRGLDRVPVHRPGRPPEHGRRLELGAPRQRLRHAPGRSDRRPAWPARASPPAPPRPSRSATRRPGRGRPSSKSSPPLPDTVTVKVTGMSAVDPRPAVTTTGPYRFLTGATQRLEGTVTGGTAPYTTGWDIDGDGRTRQDRHRRHRRPCPRAGTLVTLKATDAKGFERARRRPRSSSATPTGSPARRPRSPSSASPTSGINPYHMEYSAQTYPDPDVLALTNGFTRHPSEYITGYPASAEALPDHARPGLLPGAGQADLVGGQSRASCTGSRARRSSARIDADDAGASNADGRRHPDPRRRRARHRHARRSRPATATATARPACSSSSRASTRRSTTQLPVRRHQLVQLRLRRRRAARARSPARTRPPRPAPSAARPSCSRPATASATRSTCRSHVGLGPDRRLVEHHRRRDPARQPAGDRRRRHPGRHQRLGRRQPAVGLPDRHVSQCAFGGTSAATPYTAGIFGTVLTRVRQAIGDGEGRPAAGPGRRRGHGHRGQRSISPTAS